MKTGFWQVEINWGLPQLTEFNIQTRYPDYKLGFYKKCTEKYTSEYFSKVKEFHKWFNYRLPTKIKKIINNYLEVLSKNGIPIEEAILFGSYATGNYQKWSDIDIALVSDVFDGDRIDDKDKIRNITLSISSAIEVIPFAPKDFNLQNPLAKEILKTGIKLA